ncbi:MAG: glycine--tRNA ligase subunit beta, partial [Desulfobacteraceae bacterium]|nr:glycine--tRNA ligase subunit beta [Desulfobacteraceae bacterium]
KNEEAFGVLASSFKRIRNIVKDNSSTDVDETLFQEKAEESLFSLFKDVSEQMQKLITQKNYLKALEVLLKMKEPIDTFFDEVMVMAEDIDVRQNRLNLLTAMGERVLQIGDISKMNES